MFFPLLLLFMIYRFCNLFLFVPDIFFFFLFLRFIFSILIYIFNTVRFNFFFFSICFRLVLSWALYITRQLLASLFPLTRLSLSNFINLFVSFTVPVCFSLAVSFSFFSYYLWFVDWFPLPILLTSSLKLTLGRFFARCFERFPTVACGNFLISLVILLYFDFFF